MSWFPNSLKSFVTVEPLTLLLILTGLKKFHLELKKISMSYYYPLKLCILSIIQIWRKKVKNLYLNLKPDLKNFVPNEIYSPPSQYLS